MDDIQISHQIYTWSYEDVPVRIEVVTQRLSTTECIIRSDHQVTALILY